MGEPGLPLMDDDKKSDSPRTPQMHSVSSPAPTHDADAWAALDLDNFMPPLRVIFRFYHGCTWRWLSFISDHFLCMAASLRFQRIVPAILATPK